MAGKTQEMSPQLTLSSLFSVLALAGLCMVTGVQDLAGFDAPTVRAPFPVQAELAPSLLAD
jgi:hypothetical protein